MPLISTENYGLILQSIKKLLSFKADKDIVVRRDEIEDIDAIELSAEMGFISPVSDEAGALYTDENGSIYIL